MLFWGCCLWVSGEELCAVGSCCHSWLHLSRDGPTVLPACSFLAPVAHYILPLGANMRPWATSQLHWGYMELEIGRGFAAAAMVAGKGELPQWVGEVTWSDFVQWELCCQHRAAAVKFPAVTLRRVSSLHVIDDFEKWQIYWCPESLQPLRMFIVYLIIPWVAKTDVVAADNRERNGANDECSNTSPHWTKTASMHCGTAFFCPKGCNTYFLYIV